MQLHERFSQCHAAHLFRSESYATCVLTAVPCVRSLATFLVGCLVLLLSAQQPTTHLTKHLTERLRERLRELNTCIAELQHSSRQKTKHLTIRLIQLKPSIYNDWLGPALLTQLAGKRLTSHLIQLNICTAGLQQMRRLEGTPNKTPH